MDFVVKKEKGVEIVTNNTLVTKTEPGIRIPVGREDNAIVWGGVPSG